MPGMVALTCKPSTWDRGKDDGKCQDILNGSDRPWLKNNSHVFQNISDLLYEDVELNIALHAYNLNTEVGKHEATSSRPT